MSVRGPLPGKRNGWYASFILPITVKLIIGIGIDTHRDNTGAVVNAPIGLMERHEPVLFDDQFLADFEWALGDDGLFPPTEPYGSDWA